MELLFTGVFLLYFLSTTSCLQILRWPAMNCSQDGLRCQADVTNCLDEGWLRPRDYTPSDPINLEVDVDIRKDEQGHLLPVLVARWNAKDDGSINFLEGTLLHVLMEATNQYICVRHMFLNKITMRNPSQEMWSFSVDRVVVEPGMSYVVSVSNLPRPNLDYSVYNIFKVVTIPDCKDPSIQKTRVCLETGSLWTPNTTLERSTGPHGRSSLTVGFSTDQLAPKYRISLDGCEESRRQDVTGGNQTRLSVQFDLDEWPQSCCRFDVEIQPFFNHCSNDCVRRRKPFNICGPPQPVPLAACPSPKIYVAIAVIAVLISCGLVWFLVYKLSRRRPKGELALDPGVHPPPATPRVHPRVLVIYSQDHPLYRNIVLKLCAFLQAKCGTDVVLDLLDTAWLGTVGRLPWLEWQRQQVSGSSDKILVLCSRGVQAKWQAMCGKDPVTLREDLCSPIDDMLTPALNLFLPDMLRAAALGKYMVAYFEDVSSESDVPSVFDIAVKYRLMKNFEELCFRILNQEKYAPGQVSHIEGIKEDEYFHCQSGKELRDAIEAFQTFQKENPDWFEKECVDVEAEEEAAIAKMENDVLLQQLTAPLMECVPECRDGPPVYVCGVDVQEGWQGVQVVTADVNPDGHGSVLELLPRVNPDSVGVCLSYPVMKPLSGVTTSGLNLHTPERLPCGLSDLVCESPLAGGNYRRLQDRVGTASHSPVETREELEEDEEESYAPSSHQPSEDPLGQLISLQLSLSGINPGTGLTQNGHQSQQPVENKLPIPAMVGQSQLPFRPMSETHLVSVENGCHLLPVDQSFLFEADQSQLSFTSIQVTPQVSVGKPIQYFLPQPETSYSHPMGVGEGQLVVESPEKRPVSGSDQGYISRNSIQQDSPIEESIEDPLMALARLQQALYYNCP